jgi:hypothetical protein
MASTRLFAQGQQNFNLINKYFPMGINKVEVNNHNSLGKKSFKIKVDSMTFLSFRANPITYPQTLRFYYDINGNNIKSINSIYINNQNIDYVKTDNNFNSNDQPTLEVFSHKDTLGNWFGGSKIISEYDVNGNRTLYKQIDWNPIDKIWGYQYIIHYNYDSLNKVISQIDTNHNGQDYSVYKTDYLYDDYGNILNSNMSRLQNSIWTPNSKYDYFIDSVDMSIFSISSIWDEGINNYTKSSKQIYSFENNGKTKVISNYSWNNITWVLVTRDVFTFNDPEFNEEIAYPAGVSFIKQPISTILSQHRSDSNWQNIALQTYYYSPFKASTSTSELTETNINIYPNPSNGIVNINTNEIIESINITDVNGKLIHHQTCNSPIDLSQHVKGIYFMNIISEKGVVNKKIVLN